MRSWNKRIGRVSLPEGVVSALRSGGSFGASCRGRRKVFKPEARACAKGGKKKVACHMITYR